MSEKYDVKEIIEIYKRNWVVSREESAEALKRQRNAIAAVEKQLTDMKAVELELIEKYEKCDEGISDADRAIDFLTYGQVRANRAPVLSEQEYIPGYLGG